MDSENVNTQNQELNDVILCYKAMGLSLDAGPAQIEHTYMGLTETYRKNLSSPDPAIREDARQNISLMKEMYDKIKSSVTYSTVVREYEKSGKIAEEIVVPPPKPQVVKLENHLMHCPSCRNVISIRSKTCPICKAKIQKPAGKLLSPLNIAIASILLILGVIAVVIILNPSLVNSLRR